MATEIRYQAGWAFCNKCKGAFYKPAQATSGCPKGGTHNGSGSYNYLMPYQVTVPDPPPTPTPGAHNPIPARVAAAYWTTWNADALPLSAVDPAYNLIWLFAAGSAGTDGSVAFTVDAATKTALQAKRSAGVACLLTVGGANATVSPTTRAKSTAFVASIKSIYSQLGGFDGLDFDLEDNSFMNATELVWIGQQLKASFGADFSITWAGADPSWLTNSIPVCRSMVNAGVLDMVGVMGYDFGQTAESAKIAAVQNYVTEWVNAVGANRVCIGIQLPNADDGINNTFADVSFAITLWNWAKTTFPLIRGMDIWNAYEDARTDGHGSNGTFVSQVIPAVKG